VLYQLGYYPITLLSGMTIQLIEPVLFGRAGDGTDAGRMAHARRLNNLFVVSTMFLTLLATTLAFLLHAWLFSWLVAPQYRGVSSFLPWMVLSGGLFATGQAATLVLMTSVNTRGLIAPKIATALLGTCLNVVGAYEWGLRGVVFASVVFSLIYLGWILSLPKRSPSSG
jgi:O-antigen/teichoic acid export membrane protein